MSHSLAKDGFQIMEGILDAETIDELRRAVAGLPQRHRGGLRNVLCNSDAIADLAFRRPIKRLADRMLGTDCFPVRALVFDKVPGANWKVPWHQDTAIAVAERIETAGFVGWSVKDGVPHVHPSAKILEQMVTLRIHLDHSGTDNGPLRVLPGTHRNGKLDSKEIDSWRQRVSEVVCCVPAGGVLMMRPLLLHASSSALSPSTRRVIHIEYAARPLPLPLRWFAEASPIQAN